MLLNVAIYSGWISFASVTSKTADYYRVSDCSIQLIVSISYTLGVPCCAAATLIFTRLIILINKSYQQNRHCLLGTALSGLAHRRLFNIAQLPAGMAVHFTRLHPGCATACLVLDGSGWTGH